MSTKYIELANDIDSFLEQYANISPNYDGEDIDTKYTGPDSYELLGASLQLRQGIKPTRVWSEYGSGTYKYPNKVGEEIHKELLQRIKNLTMLESIDKKKKLLEECFQEAEKKILKEYTIAQKSKLISLITFLTQWNNSQLNNSPNKEFANELEKLTSFYRYFDGSFYEVEDDSVYEEFKSKLIELANKFRVSLPENLK